jgi:hypothetical protein
MATTIKAERQWLRASVDTPAIGVDREANVIRGMVVAQEGPFKTQGRGEFDGKSLAQIVRLMGKNKLGLKSRLAHPTLSEDGIGKFLGRVRNPQLATATIERNGEKKEIKAVRGDLYFDESAFNTPAGDLATYVMTLAESDPAALSSSLVLQVDEEWRLDTHKQPRRDEQGNVMPPLWRPTALHASDIVDTGEAVDDLLSVEFENLPDAVVRQASELIDRAFPSLCRSEVQAKLESWMTKYLANRFGVETVKVKDMEREWIAAFKQRAAGYDA